LMNAGWRSAAAVARPRGGGLAQLTSDAVPYSCAPVCAATLASLRARDKPRRGLSLPF